MKFAPKVLLTFCMASCATSLSQPEPLPSSIQLQGEEFVLSFGELDNPDAQNLELFLVQISRVSKIKLHYSNETAVQLASTPLRLQGTKYVPKEDLFSFVQILLVMNNFVVTPLGSERKGHHLVEPLAGMVPSGNMRIRSSNPYIPLSE